jgi:hypothetical protein
MNYLLVVLSLFLAGCGLRPSDSSWVTHHLENDTPLVFKDPNVLRTGLDLESRPANRGGEVWKVTAVRPRWLKIDPFRLCSYAKGR